MAISTLPPSFLVGQLLVAMPQMEDQRFSRSVIYVCAHSAEGAMGLVVNKVLESLSFPDLLEQLEIPTGPRMQQIRVHFGGPVESGRGFVLHSDDYRHDGTLMVRGGFALTATVDILKALAEGAGPRQSLLALGYAGWGPGQLESEMTANGWLTVPADPALVFDPPIDEKWTRAMGKLGINPSLLSGEAGHA
jgi:putative transcriptional regulator